VTEYVRYCYLPAIGGITASFGGGAPRRLS